jgi:hypothetical protein
MMRYQLDYLTTVKYGSLFPIARQYEASQIEFEMLDEIKADSEAELRKIVKERTDEIQQAVNDKFTDFKMNQFDHDERAVSMEVDINIVERNSSDGYYCVICDLVKVRAND